eukprot:3475918-Pleurochrysis_carterae.AAC.1
MRVRLLSVRRNAAARGCLCIFAYAPACVCAYACMRESVCAAVRACVRAFVRLFVHACRAVRPSGQALGFSSDSAAPPSSPGKMEIMQVKRKSSSSSLATSHKFVIVITRWSCLCDLVGAHSCQAGGRRISRSRARQDA